MKYFWLCFAVMAFLLTSPAFAEDGAAPAPAGKAAELPNPLDPPADDPVPAGSKPGWMSYENPFVGEQNDLTNPHLSPEEVQAWVQARTTDALTFTSDDVINLMKSDGALPEALPEDNKTKLARIKKYFTPQGWAEYATFLTQTYPNQEGSLIDMVRKQSRSITTIVNGLGAVGEKGPASGSYHWTVKEPLMLSILGIGMSTGEDGAMEQKTLLTDKYQLVVVVGRVSPAPDENGLAIETWKVMPVEAPQ